MDVLVKKKHNNSIKKAKKMKKNFILNSQSLFLIFLFAIAVNIYPQWQHDKRLTNDPNFSYLSAGNAWCIAASGDVVHVIWFDDRDGNNEIYYKRSTNRGTSWGNDIRLTNSTGSSEAPSLFASGTEVYIAWQDLRDGNDEIYFKRSLNEGINWEADTRLTNNSSNSWYPSISVFGQLVHVVWQENRDGNDEIYYKQSTDKGINWGSDIRLTNNLNLSWTPTISVSGPNVNAFWGDNRPGVLNVFYKRSTDGGMSWGTDTPLTFSNFSAWDASTSATGQVVHIAYREYIGGNSEIFYKQSLNGGVNWEPAIQLTQDSAESVGPSIAVSGLVVHIVWWKNHGGNWEIYYKRSNDGGINWGSDTRLTNNSGNSYFPSITISGSVAHVLWCDERDGNFEIYYMRDSTGNPIGIQPISIETPNDFQLVQNYPNPFNPDTKINFSLPVTGNVKLEIFDILGRSINTIVNEELNAGSYSVNWDASNYPSGIYFYRLEGSDFIETKKMVLIK